MVRTRGAVASEHDVDVWLVDFGRSMAVIDGENVSGGMVLPNGTRIWGYNPTSDTLRLLMSIHRTLIASYESAAQVGHLPRSPPFDGLRCPYMAFSDRHALPPSPRCPGPKRMGLCS